MDSPDDTFLVRQGGAQGGQGSLNPVRLAPLSSTDASEASTPFCAAWPDPLWWHSVSRACPVDILERG